MKGSQDGFKEQVQTNMRIILNLYQVVLLKTEPFNNSLTLFLLMSFTLYNLLRQGQELCVNKPSCLEAVNPWENIHFFRTVSHHNSLLHTLS